MFLAFTFRGLSLVFALAAFESSMFNRDLSTWDVTRVTDMSASKCWAGHFGRVTIVGGCLVCP